MATTPAQPAGTPAWVAKLVKEQRKTRELVLQLAQCLEISLPEELLARATDLNAFPDELERLEEAGELRKG